MKTVVVYESHWGNTEAIARAIADGIGPDAIALTTDAAVGDAIADAHLIVAGAPVMAFRLPTNDTLAKLGDGDKEPAPDLSHPSMRDWLAGLPHRNGFGAAFETRLHWSPGGSTGAIEKGLAEAGYRRLTSGRKFVVKGGNGPLREGELDAARAWGAELAHLMAEGVPTH
jgi:hypothetical protein